jgi:transposase
MAGLAGAVRRLEEYPPTLLALGRKRGLGESFQGFGRRSRQRIRHDRRHHRQGSSAQRRGAKKGGSGEAIGRSRGGLTTKIHAIVDALGNPLALCLTGGEAHDITQAEGLAAQVTPQAMIADKGYDADGFIESLKVRAITPVIPPKSNRKITRSCDFALYAERNLIERFFNTIKHFRGIATRYEKTARNFLAGLHLVCALSWLK